jgi:hypothetical protein
MQGAAVVEGQHHALAPPRPSRLDRGQDSASRRFRAGVRLPCPAEGARRSEREYLRMGGF